MKDDRKALEEVLDGLMTKYKERVPDVDGIIKAMIAEGLIQTSKDIENDHIAFRTLGVEQLGIKSLEKIFLHYGFTKMDNYVFTKKKLNAHWYAPPSSKYPRIFISELRIQDLSEKAQNIIRSYTDEVKSDPVDALDLTNGLAVDEFLHRPLWRTPTLEDYKTLAEENEYAAWTIYNRYYLNHFTVSVHNLKDGYNTIASFNEFVEKNGFILNDSGGKIKISGDGDLLQSSTVAKMVTAKFANDEEQPISGSYVEFAERKILAQYKHLNPKDITRNHRREGFETSNADKIFESTYSSQTQKNVL